MIKLLLSHGAQVNGEFKNEAIHNSSPLFVVLKQYLCVDLGVMEILLEAGRCLLPGSKLRQTVIKGNMLVQYILIVLIKISLKTLMSLKYEGNFALSLKIQSIFF